MATEVPTHAHEIMDEDRYFTIDPVTKRITAGSNNLTLAQHSKNSERFTFYIPAKAIEGHDMSICNQVLIHFQNIDQEAKSKSLGIYKVTDLKAGDDSVTLSWLVDDDATLYAGGLIFSIHFACIAEDGTVVYNFPTLTNSQVTVGETVWNSETIAKEHPDIIAEFDARISKLEFSSGIPLPTNATVGQFFRIKAVDEGGKVTEVEAVDLNADTPSAYLYNGVELPDIRSVYTPALAAAYPYAVMIRNDLIGGGSYWLYLYDTEAVAGSNGRLESAAGELHYLWTRFETGKAVNVYGPEAGTGIAGANSQVIWTNTDIRDSGGSLFLAASAPVPVYSETEEAGGAGTEVFQLSDYGISMLEVLMSGNVKTAQDCTALVDAVAASLEAGKTPVLFDSLVDVYAVVTAVCPRVQIGGTLFGDFGDYILKADVVIATDAIYLYTQQLSKE